MTAGSQPAMQASSSFASVDLHDGRVLRARHDERALEAAIADRHQHEVASPARRVKLALPFVT